MLPDSVLLSVCVFSRTSKIQFDAEALSLKYSYSFFEQIVLIACRRVLCRRRIFRLIIAAEEIRGRRSVFKAGDKISAEELEVATEKTDALRIHAYGSMLSIIISLGRGASFKEPGLAKEEGEVGSVQCLDSGFPYTSVGTVIYEVEREEIV